MSSFSTKHIGYLERDYLDSPQGKVEDNIRDFFVPEADTIRFVKVVGISKSWEQYKEKIVSLRYLMGDTIAGLYGEKIPVIYLIIGEPTKVNVFVGTYPNKDVGSGIRQESDGNLSAIITSLKSAYPGIDLVEQDKTDMQALQEVIDAFDFTGIIMGTPMEKVGADEVGVEQVERLIRGLYGTNWAYMVIAKPVVESEIVELFNDVLNEQRIIANAEKSADMSSPIAEKYRDLLGILLEKLELGKTQGMWHTAVYALSQDVRVFNRAKSLIKAVIGGKESRPDPIRVFESHDLKEKIHKFAHITTPSPPPPGKIQYPFKYLNLLNSGELTSLVHLPTEEMPGYFVKDYARFDVASHQTAVNDVINIGEVIDRGNKMGYEYRMDVKHLDRHALIVGMTGSGKTNTIFYLLKQIWEKSIPFMVIEPAKTEYRKLLHGDFVKDLQVFTLGDDNTSPFRLNPFEIMPGVSVQTHIDLLKSVFNASFIMYAPMPYVLEQCIHEIYEDKGWDLVTNENKRGFHTNAQPTLTDLYRKIDPVVNRLGYEKRITMDVKAALKTRINSLRIGGKGLMLDTRKSIPIDKLIKRPTVLELEQIGDDDEKAFIIGLLLTFLYEHYVSQGLREGIGVRHITVVEEAHRLFRNVPTIIDTEVANIKGKAVETFTNILSEIRAYGEGFLIAEQIPSKLALDVTKNTNLKVMHRIVAEDDRIIMGGTMNLKDDEERYIATLNVGEAAIYSEGDDTPILVKVPYSKIESKDINKSEENKIIQDSMKEFTEKLTEVFVPLDSCSSYCKDICKYRKEAISIVENNEFQETLSRYILSVLARRESLIEEFPRLLQEIHKLRKDRSSDSGVVLCTLLQGLDEYFETMGKIRDWKYEDVYELKNQLLSIVYEVGFVGQTSELTDDDKKRIDVFKNKYHSLCKVSYYPFSGCKRICSDNLCLYRENVLQLTRDSRLHNNFVNTLANYSGIEIWENLEKWCMVPVRRLITENSSAEEKKKIAICFTIQKAESMPYMDFFLIEKIVTNMIDRFQDMI
ncbi:MAG: DUF87 domain-containing protein [Candidatus Aegiribacteria sp.]|nr:DUF87 domain-containing protein [Candidatus Aegiribacteria sp.]